MQQSVTAQQGGQAGAARPSKRTRAEPEGVGPSVYLHPSTLARLKSFELRAKHIVEGVMSGMHRSPYFGYSIEFAQHRAYVAGDDLRHMDWKVYARTDKLQIKQYEQETNLDLVVMVDSSASMGFGSQAFASMSGDHLQASPDGRTDWSKHDHATAVAAGLTSLALRQADRVGLVVFADGPRMMLRRAGSQRHWRKIVSTLAADPVTDPGNLGKSVDRVLSTLNNKCVIAIVSDFYGDLDELKSALARVKGRGHDAIILQVIDPAERDFEYKFMTKFIGLEGEGQQRVDPRALRDAYLKVFKAQLDGVKKVARGFGFETMVVPADESISGPLCAYLAMRNNRIMGGKMG